MALIVVAVSATVLGGCANSEDTYGARLNAQIERENKAAVDYVKRVEAEGRAKIADYDRRLETWKPQAAEYFACNRKASMVVASQPGDPTSLAIAARSICGSVEAKLRKAIYDAYADDDPGFGNRTMEKVRTRVLEDNTGDI
jgi:hypothetical protein